MVHNGSAFLALGTGLVGLQALRRRLGRIFGSGVGSISCTMRFMKHLLINEEDVLSVGRSSWCIVTGRAQGKFGQRRMLTSVG